MQNHHDLFESTAKTNVWHTLKLAGLTAIPSQSARLVDSKKMLARLSEGLPWMSDAGRALVSRFVPWTRIVRDRIVHWRGRTFGAPA